MKINPASILGVCLTAAGALVLALSLFRGRDAAGSSVAANAAGDASAASANATPYLPLAIGLLVVGIIVIVLSQYLRKSPDPTDRL